MNKITIIVSIMALILVGCSDDDSSTTPSTSTLTEGTYNITGITMYDNADCSGTGGYTGMCMTDETVMTAADCPTGMCMDFSGASETDCPTGYWVTGMCADEESSEADCPTGMWTTLGWMEALDMMTGTITFGADGVFTNPDGETGTYTVNGNGITMTEDGDSFSGMLNTDGTISVTMPESAGCWDDDDEEVDAVDEDACDEAYGSWEEDSCAMMVLTLSTGG